MEMLKETAPEQFEVLHYVSIAELTLKNEYVAVDAGADEEKTLVAKYCLRAAE
jgi:hypothetical protein